MPSHDNQSRRSVVESSVWCVCAVLVCLATAHLSAVQVVVWLVPAWFVCYFAAYWLALREQADQSLSHSNQDVGLLLDEVELAYLCGGTSRVAVTVLAALILDDSLRVDGLNIRVADSQHNAQPRNRQEACLMSRLEVTGKRGLFLDDVLAGTWLLELEAVRAPLRRLGLIEPVWNEEHLLVASFPAAVGVLWAFRWEGSLEATCLGGGILVASVVLAQYEWSLQGTRTTQGEVAVERILSQNRAELDVDERRAQLRAIAVRGMDTNVTPALRPLRHAIEQLAAEEAVRRASDYSRFES